MVLCSTKMTQSVWKPVIVTMAIGAAVLPSLSCRSSSTSAVTAFVISSQGPILQVRQKHQLQQQELYIHRDLSAIKFKCGTRNGSSLKVLRAMLADVVTSSATTASSTYSTIAGSITTTTITSVLQNVITTVGSPLLAILVLASVILVHEAGHFLAARYFQIKVQEFSVGIGPKLLGYTSPKDQIDYSLRLIPFGGYVRFPENYNVTLVQQQEQQQEEEERQRRRSSNSKNNKPSTSTTVSIAPTTTTKSSDNRLQQFLTNFFSFPKPSTTPDIITASNSYKNVKSKSSSSSSSSVTALPIEYYTDPNLLQNRPWVQRLIVLSGGVIFNILLSFLLYLGQATVGYGLPKPTFAPGAMVTQEPYPTLPSYGYLHPGDVIVEINGEPLTLRNTASGLESQKGITEFIKKVRNTPEGESIQLGVIRPITSSTAPSIAADPFLNPSIQSKKPQKQQQQQQQRIPTKETIVLTPQKLRADDNSSPQSIGVMLGPNYVSTEYIRTNNLPNAIQLASNEVTSLVKDTITSFADAASTVLSAPFKSIAGGTADTKDISSSGISGPIGVLKIGTDMVRTGDINAVIFFAAAISINLAVFNSLPLPALDGGQIAFVLGEALSGKKIDQRLQEEINAIALLVLLLTSFSTVFIDL